MASIWDFLDSLPKRGDVSPEELARLLSSMMPPEEQY